MNIVFLDAGTVGDVPNLNSLNQLGDVAWYLSTQPGQTADRIRDAEIVITNKVVLDRQLIENAKKLKLICVAATGMNNIDLDAARERDIPVKNVSGYATHTVAQCTFAMILHLMQNIPFYDEYVKSGEYAKSDLFTYADRNFHELNKKRFGIIGLGSIGRKVAEIAEAFGADVVYYSTSGKNRDQPYHQVDLEELLQTSDIISIHAPLNGYTAGLINYNRLRMMKPSAILVNTGRGGIVIEKDLARALDEHLLAGAALDVFEHEPIDPENPLLTIQDKERLIMTPHIAWASLEARTLMIDGVRQNIEEFLKG